MMPSAVHRALPRLLFFAALAGSIACHSKQEESAATLTDASPTFAIGQDVFVRSVGIGRIDRLNDLRDGYIVMSESQRTVVPFASAPTLLRPLVTRAQANAIFAILRGPSNGPGDGTDDLVSERSLKIMNSGTPEDSAEFLRELYALPAPLAYRQAMMIVEYETLVIDEIAKVLATDRNAIVAEMRKLYPAMDQFRAANAVKHTPVDPMPSTVKVPIPAGSK